MEFNFKSQLELEDQRVKLEPMTSIHFKKLLPIALKNPDLLKFSPSRFGTVEFLKEYFQHAQEQRLALVRYPFVIFDKKTEKFIGSTSYGYYSLKKSK